MPSRVGCEDLQNRRVIDEKSWIPVKEKEVGEQLRACLFKDILSEGSGYKWRSACGDAESLSLRKENN